MSGKKNNVRRNAIITMAVVGVITVLVLVDGHLDSRVANHPKIVRMEVTQEDIEEKIDTVLSRQEVFNDKLDDLKEDISKLLREEY